MGRAVVAAVLAATCLAGAAPAAGAPAPHVVDPRGDWPLAAQDVVSATFATVGTGRNAALEIRVELAGPPAPDAGLYWEVGWSSPGCALSYVEYTRSAYGPGVEEAYLVTQCRPGDPFEDGGPATGRLEGSTLVLRTPLGQRYRPGTLLTEPFVQSFSFVYTYGVAPSHSRADTTAPGRPYRVGS